MTTAAPSFSVQGWETPERLVRYIAERAARRGRALTTAERGQLLDAFARTVEAGSFDVTLRARLFTVLLKPGANRNAQADDAVRRRLAARLRQVLAEADAWEWHAIGSELGVLERLVMDLDAAPPGPGRRELRDRAWALRQLDVAGLRDKDKRLILRATAPERPGPRRK